MKPHPARAQSSPDCPAHPTTLAAMRHCYRPLLVFAPALHGQPDPRLLTQQGLLDKAADDMMDRNVLYVPLCPGVEPVPPLDAPYAILPAAEQTALRKRFHVEPSEFKVILIGEDGSAKLTSRQPVAVDKLNALIDTMPMRRLEMQRPHSN